MLGIGTVLSCFTGFRGRLLLFAGCLALLGLGLNSLDLLDPEKGVRVSEKSTHSLSSGLVEQSRNLAEFSRSTTWGDAAIRIGLSFGLAMIFASLLRAFLKTMITFLLFAVGVSWFLHYQGLIEPFWKDFDFSVDDTRRWVAGQFETVKEFVGGVLPSTGAAIVGFIFGLRK